MNSTRTLIDATTRGFLMGKSIEDAYEFTYELLEEMASNAY